MFDRPLKNSGFSSSSFLDFSKKNLSRGFLRTLSFEQEFVVENKFIICFEKVREREIFSIFVSVESDQNETKTKKYFHGS